MTSTIYKRLFLKVCARMVRLHGRARVRHALRDAPLGSGKDFVVAKEILRRRLGAPPRGMIHRLLNLVHARGAAFPPAFSYNTRLSCQQHIDALSKGDLL